MRFLHPEHPGRAVRLAYCLNLHPADTLEGLLEGLRTITLPLRQRLAPGREFGVGMYAPATLVERLVARDSRRPRDELRGFLREHGLDPFTWNAFPQGGFGAAGLKERVFEPTWADEARGRYTLGVVALACGLHLRGDPEARWRLSLKTGRAQQRRDAGHGDQNHKSMNAHECSLPKT